MDSASWSTSAPCIEQSSSTRPNWFEPLASSQSRLRGVWVPMGGASRRCARRRRGADARSGHCNEGVGHWGMTELILDSLQRRMRALHSLYYDAVATMTIDHVNHFEREGVVPIAFCLFHITNMMDASFLAMTGAMPIWNDDWADRVKMTINDHGKHRTVDEMVEQRIGDYEAFQEYMRA